MELEKQVVSLDLAKRLKELGVKQESQHWWVESYDPAYKGRTWSLCRTRDEDDTVNPHISAFTVAELGEMLPDEIMDDEDGEVFMLECFKAATSHYVSYRHYNQKSGKPTTIYVEDANTEADARAKMLIYLLENKLIPSDHQDE